jgi:hypothetical protein
MPTLSQPFERPCVQIQVGQIDPDEHHRRTAMCSGMTFTLVRREPKKRFRRGACCAPLIDVAGNSAPNSKGGPLDLLCYRLSTDLLVRHFVHPSKKAELLRSSEDMDNNLPCRAGERFFASQRTSGSPVSGCGTLWAGQVS